MPSLKTILVVDDNAVNRKILLKILSKEYTLLEAENGQAALALLSEHTDKIAAIMLDIVMPVMDGYGVLETLRNDQRYSNLPIVVTTENSGNDNEIKALMLGAWDFVSKPYNAEIIKFRLRNAIDRSQLSALKQLKYLAEYDALTGVYNKAKFFDATREMIDASRDEKFVFFRFDVDRFQLINSFFGVKEGDKLLCYIAKHLEEDSKKFKEATFGRIESDIFGFCMPYNKADVKYMISHAKKMLEKYNPNYDIVPSVGIYIINDNTIPVDKMYNMATLATKKCKGNYVDYFAYYNESMGLAITTEQEITNDMNFALESGQFEIYLQPKYNIYTNLPSGAEALVRWNHPVKGMLSPGEFIPVFERNGFITKLDYYVWEEACKCIQRWKLRGIKTQPLSVNVSRVNIYNPKLVETMLDLVNRYQIEPKLLNLELTESAYTDNPTAMKKTMNQLQSYGFVIMMDDFGNGYSSLSLLKDIAIDILKIDMQFLSNTEIHGRGENIIASVIRMAKWLNIPVIAEGAETEEQVDFLRSVGCDYVQGYYFARPMPVCDYEELCINPLIGSQTMVGEKDNEYRYDDLFSFNQNTKFLFRNVLQPVVIYEFVDDKIEIIRVNEAYYALLGHEDMLRNAHDIIDLVDEESKVSLLNAFKSCVKTQANAECEYMRHRGNSTDIWIHTKLQYVSTVGNKHILIGELTDITMRKKIDFELQKYRTSLLSNQKESNTILIVDDVAVNRIILKKILQNNFDFFEAENGEEAIEVLRKHPNTIDLILLDITMPIMNGKEFLQYKKKSPELDGIPVIIITADDSSEQQISTFVLGANDYIVKPFIKEVVVRRVKNVLDSNHRFKEMVREYNSMSEQVKTDMMTGLRNRTSAETMITQRLSDLSYSCAMFMIDIDDFKKCNDTFGHAYGDKIIAEVAAKILISFRKEDIVARMGGDEFAVLLENVTDINLVKIKANKLLANIKDININNKNPKITCSLGIAISSKEIHSFEELYKKADQALYKAKCNGKNTFSIYGEETQEISMNQWINDAQSIVETIDDMVYACNKDTYEMIYANDKICKFMGITREEYNGKKCYEALMHRTVPCEFCALSRMPENKVYTRLLRMPNTQKTYLLRGKDMKRNERVIHIEIAVDVTKVENMQPYLGEATDYENK